MTPELSVHVISPVHSALVTALQERLGRHARVRHHAALPPARTLGAADVLVIDLEDPSHSPDPRHLLPLLSRLEVWFVGGEAGATAHWLDAARWPSVHVVSRDGVLSGTGLQDLASALFQRVVGPSGPEIAAMVLGREPGLASVAHLVRAICERTWEVRHPKQLAAVLGARPADVKRTLRGIGFTRVEHFITYVRWIAFEQMVGVHRLRVPLAQRLAGITDPSNLRRQLDRARRGSARAIKRLKAG